MVWFGIGPWYTMVFIWFCKVCLIRSVCIEVLIAIAWFFIAIAWSFQVLEETAR